MTDVELYHHGIIGQKWGIRRYQNEDGTLTDAGKKRYITAREKNEHAKEAMKTAKKKAIDEYNESDSRHSLRDYNNHIKEATETARQESLAKDRAYNKELRDEKKQSKESSKTDSMSDDELRKAVNRMQLEKQYSQLEKEQVKSGEDYVKSMVKILTTTAAATTAIYTIYNNVNNLGKAMKPKN